MKIRMPGLTAALIALAATGAQAQDIYPFDLAKKNPKAMQAWRNIVPKELRSIGWISEFKGTAGPVESDTLRGKPAYSGSVCMPHHCGTDYVIYIIARDGSAAAGAVVSEVRNIKPRLFGADDPETRSELEKALKAFAE